MKNTEIPRKKSIVLLHGHFSKLFFDTLKGQKTSEFFVLEGRPNLEGANITCRELIKNKITPTLITDNMAGFLFYKGLVKEVQLAAYDMDEEEKGTLCPIGGLILGVLAKKHKIPMYVHLNDKKDYLLLGKPKEIFSFNGNRVAPAGIKGYVPLVEWLPKKYFTV